MAGSSSLTSLPVDDMQSGNVFNLLILSSEYIYSYESECPLLVHSAPYYPATVYVYIIKQEQELQEQVVPRFLLTIFSRVISSKCFVFFRKLYIL